MGRGIAYPHNFYMLYDEDYFNIDNGDDEESEFDDFAFDNFKRNVMEALKLSPKYDLLTGSAAYHGRESSFFAGDQNLKVGIDISGGGPCIFVEAQWYYNNAGDEKQYKIDRRVVRAFNRLIKLYGPKMFSIATGGYSSRTLEKYAA